MDNKQKKVITLEIGDDGVYSANPVKYKKSCQRQTKHIPKDIQVAHFIVKNGDKFNSFLKNISDTVSLVSGILNKIDKI